MPLEIEKKFLISSKKALKQALSAAKNPTGEKIWQGYLHAKSPTTRVRIVNNEKAFITIKGAQTGISRPEFEYEIPLKDGLDMMDLCAERFVHKRRFYVDVAGHEWHVDVYDRGLDGLATAEIELSSESEKHQMPPWVSEDLTDLEDMSNKALAINKKFPDKFKLKD